MAKPSAVPPSVKVKSKTLTASPMVSIAVSSIVASAPAPAITKPSASGISTLLTVMPLPVASTILALGAAPVNQSSAALRL